MIESIENKKTRHANAFERLERQIQSYRKQNRSDPVKRACQLIAPKVGYSASYLRRIYYEYLDLK